MKAQQVDHGALDLLAGDTDGAIFDIGMAGCVAARVDAQRIALVAASPG